MAQLGFWQADKVPTQQCPAAVHLSLQVSMSMLALAVSKSEAHARYTTADIARAGADLFSLIRHNSRR